MCENVFDYVTVLLVVFVLPLAFPFALAAAFTFSDVMSCYFE